jgi:hypothetical protein
MTATCPACPRRQLNGLLCPTCVGRLDRDLRDVPTLVEDLQLTLARQGRTTTATPGGLAHERTGYHAGASDALATLERTLTALEDRDRPGGETPDRPAKPAQRPQEPPKPPKAPPVPDDDLDDHLAALRGSGPLPQTTVAKRPPPPPAPKAWLEEHAPTQAIPAQPPQQPNPEPQPPTRRARGQWVLDPKAGWTYQEDK